MSSEKHIQTYVKVPINITNPTALISLWKDDNIEKLSDGWLCKYCNKKFTGHNASRVAIHLSGKMLYNKKDIEYCTAEIPDRHKLEYIAYVDKKNSARCRKDEKELQHRNRVSQVINNTTIDRLAKKQKVSEDEPSRISSHSQISSMKYSSTSQISELSCNSFTGTSNSNNKKDRLVQTYLDLASVTSKSVYDNVSIDIAVSDFIFSTALPFRICEDVKFINLLNLCRNAKQNY